MSTTYGQIKKETVSIGQLLDFLPGDKELNFLSIKKAIKENVQPILLDKNNPDDDNTTHLQQIFWSNPIEKLSESEYNELFENLGNYFINSDLVGDNLRAYLEKKPNRKNRRIDNSNNE